MSTAERLRRLAETFEERQEFFDTDADGNIISDGFGPTDRAGVAWMRFRRQNGPALRLLADMVEALPSPPGHQSFCRELQDPECGLCDCGYVRAQSLFRRAEALIAEGT